jgi:hypothetical protein
MKPKPLEVLKNLTTPVVIVSQFLQITSGRATDYLRAYRLRLTCAEEDVGGTRNQNQGIL